MGRDDVYYALNTVNERLASQNEHIKKQSARIAALEARIAEIKAAYPEHCRRSGGMTPEDWPDMESALDEFESVLYREELAAGAAAKS